MQRVEVAYAVGQGKRARWNGVDVPSQEDLRSRSQVFIFVPESLLLVKGSPARRRAHLDAFAAALDPRYAAAARELQTALRQRNAQLLAVKHGAEPERAGPVGRAVRAGRRGAGAPPPRRWSTKLGELFAAIAAALAPAGGVFGLQLVAQLAGVGYDEDALLEELRERRPGETSRGLSLFGPHRDDLRFVELGPVTAGRRAEPQGCRRARRRRSRRSAVRSRRARRPLQDVAPPGRHAARWSCRGAVATCACSGRRASSAPLCSALLLAEQRLAAARTGVRGTLFLDDVMSELDDADGGCW